MRLDAPRIATADNRVTDLLPEQKPKISLLMAQEWWTIAQARSFVDVTSANPNGISKVIFDGEIPVAFAHAAFDLDRKQSWINAIYVDRLHRGQGIGSRIVEGLISKLTVIGIEHHSLGVDLDNDNAVNTYKNLGFRFTNFRVYQFDASERA
jgi:ribosomal protein S18 acetylase RimI-like enzyme